MQEAKTGEPKTDLQTWREMKMKKPDLSEPRPSLPVYYGNTEEDLRNYCATFKGYHPEVDDPLSEEVDENAVVLSGHGRKHARYRVLEKVVSPTSSFTRLRATLPDDSRLIPRRPQPRRSTSTDVSFLIFILFMTFDPAWLS